jgi:SMC interacting uncharacterized protein involved in chromosome segregation
VPNAARWKRIKADPAALQKHNAQSAAGMKRYQAKPVVREGRAEKYFRHRSRRQKEEQRIRQSGISVVTALDLVQDRTRLQKNQTRYQAEIERLAEEVLAERVTMAEAQERCDQIAAQYAAARERAAKWPKPTSSKKTPTRG